MYLLQCPQNVGRANTHTHTHTHTLKNFGDLKFVTRFKFIGYKILKNSGILGIKCKGYLLQPSRWRQLGCIYIYISLLIAKP